MSLPLPNTAGSGVRTALSLAVAAPVALCLGLAGPAALAKKPAAVEFLQYFSPLPEKTYLNESQDRLIKKKAFKVADVPDAPPVINRETGFFALISPAQAADPQLLDSLLSRESVNGLSAMVTWQQLEPQEEEFDWKPVDDLISVCAKHGKTLILRVSACGVDENGASDTPQWVFDSGIKSVEYTGVDGKQHKMPIFWDTNYLAKWNNLIQELGERYDKNPNLHSIGITGGGVRGGTAVVPELAAPGPDGKTDKATKEEQDKLLETLKREHGMTQRQLVEHWKYVADLFPQAFPTARLNFDIDPPVPGRSGQDTLDEISDYLVYRYGQRVYLTRQDVKNAKHGFDQYRVLLKFRPDTLTGYHLAESLPADALEKLTQNALEDGISFAELPVSLLTSTDEAVQKPLAHLLAHIGYQVMAQKATIPGELKAGEPLKASFAFTNLGASAPMRPVRTFDKDVASSYRVQLELRDSSGKPVVVSLHTPEVPTNRWPSGRTIIWEEELKMPAADKLQPGDYTVWLSLVDADAQRKLKLLDATGEELSTTDQIPVGKLKVTAGSSTAVGAKPSASP